ncbi:MAG TPA: deoxyribonuclease IV [Caldisericia bacterium]|nr:deoxyribonuclease IV [Caldisericia bacterium]HPP43499.1 deoxyribonuclease IV [Caldisericia bacterium]
MGQLGAHVSIAGGVKNAPLNGEKIGCEAIQIFTKNQRQWSAKPYEKKEIEEYFNNLNKVKIKKVVAHTSYLINLASPNEEIFKKSIDALIDDLERCNSLNIPFTIIHPGSHLGEGVEKGIERIIIGIERVFEKVKRGAIALETVAGQGSNIGFKFEQLKKIMEGVKEKDRIFVCFDTAHAFEAGYDIKTQNGFKKVLDEFDKIIGIEKLCAFHLNDSKTPLGSNVDRHENIGKGFLGLEPFKFLVNNKEFKEHPMILETPGGDEMYIEDLKTLNLLKSLIDE